VSRFHGTVRSEESLGSLSLVLVDYNGGSVLAAHGHARPYVSFVLEGSYTEVCAGIPRLCNPGDAVVHRPSETHADVFHRPAQLMNIEFEWPCPLEAIDGLIAQRLRSMDVPTRISRLLAGSLRGYGGRPPAPRSAAWFDRTIAGFDWNSRRPLTDAARLAGLHPTHFSRAFSRVTGMTPSAYRMRERIFTASKLLLGSTAALSSVALTCGFSDQSHFTNAFRLATGVPPSRYRRLFWR
jgi:AraC-like DNA-binding protein